MKPRKNHDHKNARLRTEDNKAKNRNLRSYSSEQDQKRYNSNHNINTMKENTKHTKYEALGLLQQRPFDPRLAHFPEYPILGSELHFASGDAAMISLGKWIQSKFEDLGVTRGDYLLISDVLCEEEEYHLCTAAGLKIASTFENEIGAAVRCYLDKLPPYSSAQAVEKIPVIDKLKALYRDLKKDQQQAAEWYAVARRQHQYSREGSGLQDPNSTINTTYANDVVELTENLVLHSGTERFKEVREIVHKLEALYASREYADAVEQSHAYDLANNPQHN